MKFKYTYIPIDHFCIHDHTQVACLWHDHKYMTHGCTHDYIHSSCLHTTTPAVRNKRHALQFDDGIPTHSHVCSSCNETYLHIQDCPGVTHFPCVADCQGIIATLQFELLKGEFDDLQVKWQVSPLSQAPIPLATQPLQCRLLSMHPTCDWHLLLHRHIPLHKKDLPPPLLPTRYLSRINWMLTELRIMRKSWREHRRSLSRWDWS